MAQGFMSKVYGWMTAGLLITAGITYYLSPTVNPELFKSLQGSFFILCLIQFALVMYFTFAWKSLNYTTLATIFLVYSGLTGVILSPILYVYTGESVFQIFLIAAAMFGTMALYGTVTRSDLSSLRNILLMGLIGLIIANLINFFWQNAQFNIMTSCIGVGIFSLLVAYDVQRLRSIGYQVIATEEDINKLSLLGALTLYLNIINIFLYLLDLFGKKRN